jgi:hypothetical protein
MGLDGLSGVRVKDLTAEQLRQLIRDVVRAELEEFAADPDRGLELRPDVRERLLRQQSQESSYLTAEEVAERLQLKDE